MSLQSGGGIINDLISRDDLARLVGEGFSEARWNEVAQGRDKIPRSELMDVVQGIVAKQHIKQQQAERGQPPSSSASPSSASSKESPPTVYASARTEAILSLLMFCDRGGKQLLAAYPALGPRKGGAGPDLREGALRAVRETSPQNLRRAFMEVEARLCMADQRGADVDLDAPITDRLISLLCDDKGFFAGPKLSKVCEGLLRFAASDKGDPVRKLDRLTLKLDRPKQTKSLTPPSPSSSSPLPQPQPLQLQDSKQSQAAPTAGGSGGGGGEVVGGSEETKALVGLADSVLALLLETNPDPTRGGSSGSGGPSLKAAPAAETKVARQAVDLARGLVGQRRVACRLVGHCFQLLTGLLVDKCPQTNFAEANMGKVFDMGSSKSGGSSNNSNNSDGSSSNGGGVSGRGVSELSSSASNTKKSGGGVGSRVSKLWSAVRGNDDDSDAGADGGDESDDDLGDIRLLEGVRSGVTSKLSRPVRHEVMVNEMKERGNKCLKRSDLTGAVAAYTSALGQGLWVEQAIELVEAMANQSKQQQEEEEADTSAENDDGDADDEEGDKSQRVESTEGALQSLSAKEKARRKGEKEAAVGAAEKELLVAHAQTAAALLANRSLAYAKLGDFIKAHEDAMTCLRCAPLWPKAHFRRAVALKLAGQPKAAAEVLKWGLDHCSQVDPATVNESGTEPIVPLRPATESSAGGGGLFLVKALPWVKDFKRELKVLSDCDGADGGDDGVDDDGGGGGGGGKGGSSSGKEKPGTASALKKRGKKDKAAFSLDETAANTTTTLTNSRTPKTGGKEEATVTAAAVATAPATSSPPPPTKPRVLTSEEWEYGDIMSKEWGCILVALALLSGYIRSALLLTFAFSAAVATIVGAPDPRKRRAYEAKMAKRQKRRAEAGLAPSDGCGDEDENGGDDEEDEDDEKEYETEAGLLLSQWMVGKSEGGWSMRGMGKRNVTNPSADAGDGSPAPGVNATKEEGEKKKNKALAKKLWFPSTAADSTPAKKKAPSSKIMKLSKLD